MLLAVVMIFTACSTGNNANNNEPTPTTPVTAAPSDEDNQVTPDADIPDTDEPDAAATRIFTDSLGREVELPVNLERVAASGNLAQIALFAIVPDLLVGLAVDWGTNAAQYLHEDYTSLPIFGEFYGKGELSMEQILLANPQVIVDVGEPKATAAEDMDAITEQMGIPTVFIEAHLDTMDEAYLMLGELFNMQDRAKVLSDYCHDVYAMCNDIMLQVGDDKTSLLYCRGTDGLSVIANGVFQGQLIDFASNNLAVLEEPSSKGTGNVVSMEQILLWNPEVIIFETNSIYSTVADDETWQQLDAIKNSSYFEVPEGPYNWMGFPASVNRYLGMLWMCDLLYPDKVTYNLKDEVVKYYDLFYHCDLTDEQYDALVNK